MNRIVLAALALTFVVACKPKAKECPTCKECPPVPPAPTCTEAKCDVEIDDGGAKLVVPSWRLVEKDGKRFLTTTLADKREIAVPVSATTPVLVDGKESNGEVLLGGPGGGCPCRLPQCMPYCRPIGSVLSPSEPAPPQ